MARYNAYYQQFEPWRPAHSVLFESDRVDAINLYIGHYVIGLTPVHKMLARMDLDSAKIVDTAIAHAIRESYRN